MALHTLKHTSSTAFQLVKEAWFYQLHNMVGEVGGCLGMFLGVSLVSLYQMTVGAVHNVYRHLSG